MIFKSKILFIIYLILNITILIKASKENCKIIFDKKTSKYILNGKCNDGIYYVNNLDGKKTSELNYDICAKKGSITRYVVVSGKISSSSCVNIMDNTVIREESIIYSRSGSDEDDDEKSYKLFDDKNSITPTTNSSPAYLFYCNGNNSDCSQITNVGYYINDESDIYSCSIESEEKCIKVGDITETTQCTPQTIGTVFYKSNGSLLDFYICLNHDGTNSAEIPLSDEAGSYLVGFSNNNIYGITNNNYAIVDVKENSVEMRKPEMKYIYVDKSNNKILNRGDECPNTNDILELINNNNEYVSSLN